MWGADDLIDYYAAWAWKPRDVGWMLPQQPNLTDGPSPTWLAVNSFWKDEEWWRSFIRRGAVHHHDPFNGGTDSLHLAAHSGREDQRLSQAAVSAQIAQQRTCVLVTESLDTWMADLDELGSELPHLGDRSWRIEVFERSTGWLGKYRRSRDAGRWFQGKHNIHLWGHE